MSYALNQKGIQNAEAKCNLKPINHPPYIYTQPVIGLVAPCWSNATALNQNAE